ncbi:type I CRISPR-associated protein Cas7, partial [bacterium]|nr:type I CRISPR-associated protein Cas7 [bacterium]
MKAPFNRCVGLIVLDVTMSNPNGDPDMESNPRMLEADNRGVISPVSFKRKMRDLVADQSPVFQSAKGTLQLEIDGDNAYEILESRGRDRDKIKKMDKAEFQRSFWDARVFGNTFLESMKDDKDLKDKNVDHFISTGVIQIGVGLSVAPIDIEMMTLTNKSGVEEGKDRGMAPLAFRVVRHGIYTIPFYVNPSIALKTGATQKDLDLFKFMLPYSYQHTSSAIRPQVSILHAWFAEHKNPLGSCPEYQFINTLTPSIKKDKQDVESTHSMGDY